MRLEPYKHQAKEFEEHRHERCRALLWGMRLGKTKAVIDTACSWVEDGCLDAILIVAPNNVHVNWVARELPKHWWDGITRYKALAWRQPLVGDPEFEEAVKRVFDADAPGVPVLAFNTEGLLFPKAYNAIKRAIRRFPRILLVVDESHHFGRVGSKRSKRLQGIARKCVYRRILTGTPVHNSPLKAYAQFQLVMPGGLGFERYGDFEHRYAEYEMHARRDGRQFPKLKGYRNLEELRGRIGLWSSVVDPADCPDLPERIETIEYYEPSAMQLAKYRRLENELAVWLDSRGDDLEVPHAAGRLVKMQQLLSNFILDEEGEPHDVSDGDPRTEATVKAVQAAGGRAIVWCRFREEIKRVSKAFEEVGKRVLIMAGGAGQKARDGAVEGLQSGRVDVIVGQPAVGGEGLDFSAVDTIVWHSQTFDAIHRDQASERCTRVGERPANVIHVIAPGTVDEYILATTDRKMDVADHIAGGGLLEWLASEGRR